jgi:hypothetical protein
MARTKQTARKQAEARAEARAQANLSPGGKPLATFPKKKQKRRYRPGKFNFLFLCSNYSSILISIF